MATFRPFKRKFVRLSSFQGYRFIVKNDNGEEEEVVEHQISLEIARRVIKKKYQNLVRYVPGFLVEKDKKIRRR